MTANFIVAAAQLPISAPGSWEEFAEASRRWVEEAARRGARLLVFPEYGAMALAALLPAAAQADLRGQIIAMQDFRAGYLDLFGGFARKHGAFILASSFPWEVAPGRFHNRSWFFGADGARDFQDKRAMTRFEREAWGIQPGAETKVFDTELGKIGVAICYDAEFPLPIRAQVAAGAQLILIPSCTEDRAGWQRVRIAARARALEGQCYVVQAPLVGDAPWSPAVDVNVGAAGIFGPPDHGFPDDGIVEQGRLNEPGWICARLEPDRVSDVRTRGRVLNFRHWPEASGQDRPEVGLPPVQSVRLR